MSSRPLAGGALLSDHKHDSVDKDFALPNKKIKLDDDNKDSRDNSHHVLVPMSCDDPKVAKNDSEDKREDLFTIAEAREEFDIWCKECNKTYHSEEEELYRFEVFRETLERVTYYQNLGEARALNDYSDLTYEEKVSMLFCRCYDSESDTEQDHTQER